MNILFITNSIGYGGAEKMMNFVTNSLIENGDYVIILNFDTVSRDINTRTQILNKKIKVINWRNQIGNKNVKSIQKIIDIVKNYRIDVTISFTMFPNFYSVVASKFTGKPAIISERGDPFRTFTTGLKDRLMKFVINKADGAVFQTYGASEFYNNSLRRRGTIIPNPVDNKQNIYWKHDPNTKTIVYLGRFDNVQKRLDILFKAFSIFVKKHKEYTLSLFGSGDEKYLDELLNQNGIKDKVMIKGVSSNSMHDLSREGIFALSSDYEGIPNSLLEAMAIGMPVISTDCSPGGARLLIKNRENGLLVPNRDFEALANAMRELAENNELAEKCAQKAKEVVKEYSSSRISKLWCDYVTKIAKGCKHGK